MALPPGFDEWNNLKDLIKLEHNKAVRAYFKNQADDDVSTPKKRLKHSCLIKDDDTVDMVNLRLWIFEITIGHAQSIQRPVYAVPNQSQEEWKFRPFVTLNFLEPYDEETHGIEGINQLEGEISFRLMDETSESMSRVKAEALAKAIKREFGQPIFTWQKGWFKSTYLDLEHGYDLRLLVKSKTEGERVARAVLGIQGHSFERNNFQFVDHDRTYSINPGTHRVYGQTVKKPVKRRRCDVKFKNAQLFINGLPNAINLVATSGTRLRSVIERI